MTTPADRDLLKLDLYHLLDPTNTLTSTSLPADISRHYRKQARLLHPDKNPNNPKAAEQFDRLQRAYTLLTDTTQRAEYDERHRKREEKVRKVAAEDVRVRVMRERLEERERQSGKIGWESNKRQMHTARIQRENEAVIQQLRQQHTPHTQRTGEARREERKQAEEEVGEGRYGDRRGEKGGEVDGMGASGGLDMKAYETSTLERMREMARRKKAEKENQQQKQQQTNPTTPYTTRSVNTDTSSSQKTSEVIVLDDTSTDVT